MSQICFSTLSIEFSSVVELVQLPGVLLPRVKELGVQMLNVLKKNCSYLAKLNLIRVLWSHLKELVQLPGELEWPQCAEEHLQLPVYLAKPKLS